MTVAMRARFPLQGLGFKPKTRTLDMSWSPLNMKAARKLCEFKGADGKFGKLQELLSEGKSLSGKHVYLELAGAGALEVEEMIRAAAQRGEGFALDEFDQDGLLNRKLLKQSATLVARRVSDHVLIGGSVVGPSALARARDPTNLAGYIIVGEKFRRCGYGTEIAELCEKLAKDLGYINITSDVLYNPEAMPGFKLALRRQYVVTGELPQCAYVKGVGLTGSFIMFKRVSPLPQLDASL